MDPVSYLFDDSVFTPRAACGPGWNDGLVVAFQLAETTIAVAYVWIACVLAKFWHVRRSVIPRPAMLLVFGVFILLCGLTHVCGLVAFYTAPYRLFLVVWWATAVVSIATAAALRPAARYVAGLPTPEEFRRALDDRDRADALTRRRTDDLVAEFERQSRRAAALALELEATKTLIVGLQTKAEHARWRATVENDLNSLREQLHRIRGVA